MFRLSSIMSNRLLNTAGLLGCILLLAVAVYMQIALSIAPCPLCVAQRLVFIILAIIFFVAVIHNPMKLGNRIYAGLIMFFALVGIGLASRQIYLQMQPPDPNAICLPGLLYMLKVFPLTKVLSLMLTGSGTCGVVAWKFLGLTTPMWALLWFIGFFCLGLWRTGVKS